MAGGGPTVRASGLVSAAELTHSMSEIMCMLPWSQQESNGLFQDSAAWHHVREYCMLLKNVVGTHKTQVVSLVSLALPILLLT